MNFKLNILVILFIALGLSFTNISCINLPSYAEEESEDVLKAESEDADIESHLAEKKKKKNRPNHVVTTKGDDDDVILELDE